MAGNGFSSCWNLFAIWGVTVDAISPAASKSERKQPRQREEEERVGKKKKTLLFGLGHKRGFVRRVTADPGNAYSVGEKQSNTCTMFSLILL